MGDDIVDTVVSQWERVHPGLDTTPMQIIGRINRCAALLQQAADASLRTVGISRSEFDLLGALRRVPHPLTPGQLARETSSSGAAVSKRVRQLRERGLVEREIDARDKRVAKLRLTDEGQHVVDQSLPDQLAFEESLLAGLPDSRRGDLRDALSALLIQLEGRLGARSG